MNKLFLEDEFTDSELRELENSFEIIPPWFHPAHFIKKLFCESAFKVSSNHYQITGIWLSWANSKWNPSVPENREEMCNLIRQEWWRENSDPGAENADWNPQHKNAWGGFLVPLWHRRKRGECRWIHLPSSQGFNRLQWKFQGKYHHQLLGGVEQEERASTAARFWTRGRLVRKSGTFGRHFGLRQGIWWSAKNRLQATPRMLRTTEHLKKQKLQKLRLTSKVFNKERKQKIQANKNGNKSLPRETFMI